MRKTPSRNVSEGQDGFTLIELLVVIIIIAILASIALPTYLGTRSKSHDARALSLVRNALTVVESVNVDYRDYTLVTAAELSLMEPGITWHEVGIDLVDPSVPTVLDAVAAHASDNAVDYHGHSATEFDIASISESGNLYGIQVQTAGLTAASYVKVKVVEGTSSLGW